MKIRRLHFLVRIVMGMFICVVIQVDRGVVVEAESTATATYSTGTSGVVTEANSHTRPIETEIATEENHGLLKTVIWGAKEIIVLPFKLIKYIGEAIVS